MTTIHTGGLGKRGNSDYLTDAERDAMHRDIRAGLSTKAIAARYNISTRTVNVHAARMGDKPRKTINETTGSSIIRQICYVEGCTNPQAVGKFCADHEPSKIPEAQRKRLMAGR